MLGLTEKQKELLIALSENFAYRTQTKLIQTNYLENSITFQIATLKVNLSPLIVDNTAIITGHAVSLYNEQANIEPHPFCKVVLPLETFSSLEHQERACFVNEAVNCFIEQYVSYFYILNINDESYHIYDDEKDLLNKLTIETPNMRLLELSKDNFNNIVLDIQDGKCSEQLASLIEKYEDKPSFNRTFLLYDNEQEEPFTDISVIAFPYHYTSLFDRDRFYDLNELNEYLQTKTNILISHIEYEQNELHWISNNGLRGIIKKTGLVESTYSISCPDLGSIKNIKAEPQQTIEDLIPFIERAIEEITNPPNLYVIIEQTKKKDTLFKQQNYIYITEPSQVATYMFHHKVDNEEAQRLWTDIIKTGEENDLYELTGFYIVMLSKTNKSISLKITTYSDKEENVSTLTVCKGTIEKTHH